MNQPHKQLHNLDKKRIRASFNAAAEHYDEAAVLQREVGSRILERLELIRIKPDTILDVGAGTGILSQALGKRFKQARVVSLDLASHMLLTARGRNNWLSNRFGRQSFICGDAEQLPIADNSMDLVFSNLAIQWCGELEQTFAEFRRVLKPEGLLMFSTFGPDTLKELRASWRAADNNNTGTVRVNDFIDMHDVGDALLRAKLADPVMDVENFTLTYPDAYQLMRELKTIGAHNAASERPHGLTGKTRLRNMIAAYESYRSNGTLPATYEVVYGHAWAPVTKGNEFSIPVESLKARTDRP